MDYDESSEIKREQNSCSFNLEYSRIEDSSQNLICQEEISFLNGKQIENL